MIRSDSRTQLLTIPPPPANSSRWASEPHVPPPGCGCDTTRLHFAFRLCRAPLGRGRSILDSLGRHPALRALIGRLEGHLRNQSAAQDRGFRSKSHRSLLTEEVHHTGAACIQGQHRLYDWNIEQAYFE